MLLANTERLMTVKMVRYSVLVSAIFFCILHASYKGSRRSFLVKAHSEQCEGKNVGLTGYVWCQVELHVYGDAVGISHLQFSCGCSLLAYKAQSGNFCGVQDYARPSLRC